MSIEMKRVAKGKRATSKGRGDDFCEGDRKSYPIWKTFF